MMCRRRTAVMCHKSLCLWFLWLCSAQGFQSFEPLSARRSRSIKCSQSNLSTRASPPNDPDKDETSSSPRVDANADLLKKLDQIFDYEGRIQTDDRDNYRCGFVSLIGAPNMGKSTLLNALLKEDLCIATRRPQTTRHAILGILSGKGCQVCLVDTPGVIETPAYKLQEGMMEAVAGAFHSADGLLVVTDVFSTPIPDDALFQKLQKSRKPIIVVVNKVDLVNVVKDKHDPQKRSVGVEEAVAVWRQLLPSALAILPVTASAGPDDPGVIALRHILTGGPNVAAAMRNLGRPVPGMLPAGQTQYWTDEHIKAALLPLSPPLYDQDVLTDRTERFVASEMIRAALFETFRKELPYCCEVQVTGFNEPKESDLKKGKKQITRISADIIVERESQKIIVIGKKGEQIKNVGIKAREKLEDFLQSQVYLNLRVKVNKDWRKKEDKLKAFGYLQ